jgi:hypothetical protein
MNPNPSDNNRQGQVPFNEEPQADNFENGNGIPVNNGSNRNLPVKIIGYILLLPIWLPISLLVQTLYWPIMMYIEIAFMTNPFDVGKAIKGVILLPIVLPLLMVFSFLLGITYMQYRNAKEFFGPGGRPKILLTGNVFQAMLGRMC